MHGSVYACDDHRGCAPRGMRKSSRLSPTAFEAPRQNCAACIEENAGDVRVCEKICREHEGDTASSLGRMGAALTLLPSGSVGRDAVDHLEGEVPHFWKS